MGGRFWRRCGRWATVFLLVCGPGWPQPMAEQERTVELALAESESSARIVARAMWSDFLVDQLLIPGARYLGRVPWSRLQPGMQGALEDVRPGEPQVLTNPRGQLLVVRVLPSLPPALLGEEEYAIDAEEIRAILSVGPTDPTILSVETDVDTEDLTAVCRSKRALIEGELRRVRAAVAGLSSETSPERIIRTYSEAISILSLEGELEEAIELVEGMVARLPPPSPGASRSPADLLHQIQGVLELRRGEVENCLHDHHREMCLFPLSAAARHRIGDGARRAVEHFTRYLERHPDDLEVRWLLNIAAMTVGTYPDGVAERFRIEPQSFASAVDPGRFWDVAGSAGLAYPDNAGGSVADDFDGDGLLDIVVSSRDPCEPLRLYRNQGDGTFGDVSEAVGLGSQLGGLNVTQTDYDNDGRRDLYVMRGGWETAIRDSLLRNRETADGGLVFEDTTARAGLGGPGQRTHSVAWADYDGDGWLDLFVGHELSFSQLFRNRGDGTFEDVTSRSGVRFRSLTKGATWGDIDGDGWPDLYVSNFGDRNLLFHNLGDGTFAEVARERGVAEPTYSFATWFWDYDNDGLQDLFVATLLQTVDDVAREYLGLPPQGETLRIYRGTGDGRFADVTEALEMARVIPTMGANFGDLDSDGYLDLYLGTGAPPYAMLIPNRMFLNLRGQSFVDVTSATGTGHLQKGHGVAFADFDNDGDQDVFANLGGAFPGDKYPSALFQNPGHGNDWIALELQGRRSNRAAIGARIRVLLDAGDGREEQRVRWVTSGGSFGASPLLQHVGLGPDAEILRIEIDWPARRPESGSEPAEGERRQVLRDVPVNSYLVVTEGVPGFVLAPRRRLELGAGEAAGRIHAAPALSMGG